MDTTMNDPNPPPGASHSSAAHPLTRSRHDRMIAGVAGGFARKYNFDPAIVRVAFVGITVLSFGAAVIGYVVAWLVVPEADADEPVLTNAVRGARLRPFDRRLWIGLALLFFGAEALADQYGYRVGRFSHVFWPMALIAIGASFLLLRERDDDRPSPPRGDSVPVAPPSTSPPPTAADPGPAPAPGSAPAADDPSAAGVTARTGVGPVVAEADEATAPFPQVPPVPPVPPSAYPPSRPWPDPKPPRVPRRSRRERSMLGRLTWSALLIVAGAAWLLDVVGAVNVDGRFVLAIELAVVGAALVVGAFIGRARGLIAIGIVLAVFAGMFSVLDLPLRGPIGETVVRPESLRSLHSSYELGIGHMLLDLGPSATDGRSHRVDLRDTIGFLEVRVPSDARVEVIAKADTGSLDILGRPERGGTHVHKTVTDAPVGTSGPLLVIDAHVGFGAIRVTREGGFTS